MNRPRVIAACAAAGLIATIVVGDPLAASPQGQIKAKAAQAAQVLQQVNALDVQFEHSVEAWNGAKYELDKAKRQLAADRIALRFAERQRKLAISRVEARLVALYESSDDPTTIAVVLGSSNVSDLLGRLDAAHTIAAADHQLAVQTTAARDQYATTERRMRATTQTRAVALTQLASERAQIGSMLTKRRQLLSSIQSEVAKLKAQEAQRQAALAAQARARLAQEQAALRQQAVLRQQAEQQARATAAARASASKAATESAAPLAITTPQATPAAPLGPAATAIPTVPLAPAPAAGGHPEAATIALRYLGVPYVWGGATPGGFDCSGLVMYVYAQLGISLPHYAAAQYGFGSPVSRDQLQPGDLVFFDGLNHVGIYIGGGQMIHAPHTGDVVRIGSLSDFGAGYIGARRI